MNDERRSLTAPSDGDDDDDYDGDDDVNEDDDDDDGDDDDNYDNYDDEEGMRRKAITDRSFFHNRTERTVCCQVRWKNVPRSAHEAGHISSTT